MLLGEIFKKENIMTDLQSEDKDELFEEMTVRFKELYSNFDKDEALKALWKREEKMTTGVIPGVAIPHAVCKSVEGICGLIGISKTGIEYESVDGKDVNLVVMLVTGEDEIESHIHVLQRLERILNNPIFIENLISLNTEKEIYDKIIEAEMNL